MRLGRGCSVTSLLSRNLFRASSPFSSPYSTSRRVLGANTLLRHTSICLISLSDSSDSPSLSPYLRTSFFFTSAATHSASSRWRSVSSTTTTNDSSRSLKKSKDSSNKMASAAAATTFVDTAAAAAAAAATGDKREAPSGFRVVHEGNASILFPESNEVFYNPVQVFNRDLSTAVIGTWAREYQADRARRREEKVARREKEFEEAQKKSKSAAVTPASTTTEACLEPTPPPTPAPLSPPRPVPEVPAGVTVLEALAATGLRSIRYKLEIPEVERVVCNDVSAEAVANIRRNVEFCGLDPAKDVIPNEGDANAVMHAHATYNTQYDCVDLDPYGTAAPFTDAAVRAVRPGGLLAVTCTDMAILAGNHAETCYAKYGSMPLKGRACHEMAVRIVLNNIHAAASRHQRYIVPLLSCSIDFYIRVFVKVFSSAAEAKRAASRTAYVYQCVGCQTHFIQPVGTCAPNPKKKRRGPGSNSNSSDTSSPPIFKPGVGPPVGSEGCPHCGRRCQLGGPVWSDPLHDRNFCDALIADIERAPEAAFATRARMLGHVSVCREELPDTMLYPTVDGLAGVVHCCNPSHSAFRSALVNGGYRVSSSHAEPRACKTDAPSEFVWDVIRTWVRDRHPVKADVLTSASPAAAILSKPPTARVDFTLRKDADSDTRRRGLVRFPENPEANWGPKARAGTKRLTGADGGGSSGGSNSMEDKRARNQGKKKPSKRRPRSDIPCQRFRRGICDRGDECAYSHDPDAVIPPELMARSKSKRKKRRLQAREEKNTPEAVGRPGSS